MNPSEKGAGTRRNYGQTGGSGFSNASTVRYPQPSPARQTGDEGYCTASQNRSNRERGHGTEQLRWDATSGRLVVEEDPCGQGSGLSASRVPDKPVVTDMASAGFF